jgi:CRISPR-associated protein Cas1
MSHHIITISTHGCFIGCKNNQIILQAGEEKKSLPLEDTAALIVTSRSATFHSHLMQKASESGVIIIFCRNFRPSGILLPANRHTDTLLSRALAGMDSKLRENLWKATVNAKCANQYTLASGFCGNSNELKTLRRVAFDAKPHKEAMCAKLYWKALGQALGDRAFRRDPTGGGLNSLLNYGYAVLLSALLQRLLAVGLDPCFGISHVLRERSTPLGYDLMEPFRPLIDRKALALLLEMDEECPEDLSQRRRQKLASVLEEKIPYLGTQVTLHRCLELVVRGFRQAILQQKASPYKPWTPKNLKWDGYS